MVSARGLGRLGLAIAEKGHDEPNDDENPPDDENIPGNFTSRLCQDYKDRQQDQKADRVGQLHGQGGLREESLKEAKDPFPDLVGDGIKKGQNLGPNVPWLCSLHIGPSVYQTIDLYLTPISKKFRGSPWRTGSGNHPLGG